MNGLLPRKRAKPEFTALKDAGRIQVFFLPETAVQRFST
jgi:hypothetical protein